MPTNLFNAGRITRTGSNKAVLVPGTTVAGTFTPVPANIVTLPVIASSQYTKEVGTEDVEDEGRNVYTLTGTKSFSVTLSALQSDMKTINWFEDNEGKYFLFSKKISDTKHGTAPNEKVDVMVGYNMLFLGGFDLSMPDSTVDINLSGNVNNETANWTIPEATVTAIATALGVTFPATPVIEKGRFFEIFSCGV